MNRLIPYSGEVYAYLLAGYSDAYIALEIAVCLAGAALLLTGARATLMTCRIAGAVLAILWAWIGVGFYWLTYQPLNWAGFYFGWAALLQAVLILVWSLPGGRFRPTARIAVFSHWMGLAALILAALMGPFMRLLSEGSVTAIQAVGVTPLATVTATLALFLLNTTRIPFWLLPVPVILLVWDFIRAQVLGVVQDNVLLAAAAAVLVFLLHGFLRFRQSGEARDRRIHRDGKNSTRN